MVGRTLQDAGDHEGLGADREGAQHKGEQAVQHSTLHQFKYY